MPVGLPPFDPSRNFKALRFCRIQGVVHARQQAISDEIKAAIPFHILANLYRSRHIGYADEPVAEVPEREQTADPGGEGSETPSPPSPPNPPQPDEGELIKALIDGNTHAQLWERAQALEAERGIELGIKKSDSKTKIATAIVRAGNGAS